MTAIMAAVIALTFLFGFGNVLALGLRLGVPAYVAPLVAPAVDLSVLGLLLGVRYLALNGAAPEAIRPARRLLVLASVMTLALNVTEPLLVGHYGKAAFDAVGPLLLIGWAEVGPGLLQAIADTEDASRTGSKLVADSAQLAIDREGKELDAPVERLTRRTAGARSAPRRRRLESVSVPRARSRRSTTGRPERELLERAREEDARHRQAHQRPISAETLRKRLGVGAGRSRALVAAVRSEVNEEGTAESWRRRDGAVSSEEGIAVPGKEVDFSVGRAL
ncbi:DUF2637 domain-containing protein [Streptomyces mayteni]